MSNPLADGRYVDWAHKIIVEEADRGLRAGWMLALASRALGNDEMVATIVQGLLMRHAWRSS